MFLPFSYTYMSLSKTISLTIHNTASFIVFVNIEIKSIFIYIQMRNHIYYSHSITKFISFTLNNLTVLEYGLKSGVEKHSLEI